MMERKEREAPLALRRQTQRVIRDVMQDADIFDPEDPWPDRLELAIATVLGAYDPRPIGQFETRFTKRHPTPDGFYEYVQVSFG